MERRMGYLSHPDLPYDASGRITKDHDASSSRSWRPSWLSRASMSSRSGSSRPSSGLTTSSLVSQGPSISTRRETADYENVYQLPAIQGGESGKEESKQETNLEAIIPDMRYEYLDETFEFPLPSVMRPVGRKEQMPVNHSEIQAGACTMCLDNGQETNRASCSKSIGSEGRPPSSTTYGSGGRNRPPSRAATSISTSRRTTCSRKTGKTHWRERDENAEIEMASREQYGYWRATFTSRLPPAAAMCGAWILTANICSRNVQGVNVMCDLEALDNAADLCLELEQSPSPEHAVELLRTWPLERIVHALKASFDGSSIPEIPVKIAVQIYRKVAEAKDQPRKREGLCASVVKLLRKVPQDILVTLIFLLSISKRLRGRGLLIDSQEPAILLLRKMWPTSLALSQDRHAGNSVSKTLVTHFDELPCDWPLVLDGVNYRFRDGKKRNMLTAIER